MSVWLGLVGVRREEILEIVGNYVQEFFNGQCRTIPELQLIIDYVEISP